MEGRWKQQATAGGASTWIEEVEASWGPEEMPRDERYLTPEHWQEIVAITDTEWDLDRFKALVTETEEVLSLYPALLEALESSPSPAEKLAYLEPLLQRAERVLANLDASEGDALWFDFALQGTDYARTRTSLVQALQTLLAAGRQVATELEGTDPRSGPVEQVQRLLVADLRRLFDSYCSPILLEDEGMTNIARTRFVRLCLDAARIEARPAALAAAHAVKPEASLLHLVRRPSSD